MFDLIILGGGPAGYLAAERAGEAGLSVILIEKGALGGVCLNEGCIPSKTLLNSAKMYAHALHSEKFGVKAEAVTYDQAVVVARKNKVVKTLVSGVRSTLKANNVTLQAGHGRIVDQKNGVIRVSVDDEIIEGRRLLIATGSEAIIPPIPGVREGLESGHVLTNREILDLKKLPESLVVIGGGVVGLEMASYFQTCNTQVTVVEMLDHIAGGADREIGKKMQKAFEKQGITFCLNSTVTQIKPGSVISQADDGTKEIPAEKVLLSVGRRPVVSGIGLENIGVYVERGRIVTDQQGLTNVPDVYAAGDVNGVWMLAHAAYREAEVAVNTMLGKRDTMRYHAMPSVIYSNPEMAYVGETEESCQEKELSYRKIVLPMQFSGRYKAETEAGDGQIKLLIDTERDCILGCHMLGLYVSELILSVGWLIETEMKRDAIKELIFPHPTVGEVIREAIFRV